MKLARLGKVFEVEKIEHYIKHAERQVEQIDRRVLKGEIIPHSEKVFSIFIVQKHIHYLYIPSRGFQESCKTGLTIKGIMSLKGV